MSLHFEEAIKQLYHSLSLSPPVTTEWVTSLQVGDHLCHLTEHPADYLLMFVPVTPAAHAMTEEQNLFSQDPCKPILGLDPVSQGRVLWSRQHLLKMDRATAYHQLEQLVHAANELSQPV
jgi:Tir chaperone protein (CesT) family